MKIVLDLETCCNVDGCPGFGESTRCSEKHALDWNRGRITLIGVCYEKNDLPVCEIFKNIQQFKDWLFIHREEDLEFIGHNFKFDLHFLRVAGVDLIGKWHACTQLMASIYLHKIPDEWLEEYNSARTRLNKQAGGVAGIHRKAGGYSLKTLAPYFLNIDPFWEQPSHEDEEYLKKDVLYTWGLYWYFLDGLEKEQGLEFFTNRMMSWAKMLYNSEVIGVNLDFNLLEKLEISSADKEKVLRAELDLTWSRPYDRYRGKLSREILEEMTPKKDTAIQSRISTARKQITKVKSFKAKRNVVKKLREKISSAKERYLRSYNDRIAAIPKTFNYASDKQMLWLFKDHFKLDCEVEAWDKSINRMSKKFSTGTEVIQRFAAQGRDDAKIFKKLREAEKLLTSFFPSYRKHEFKGRIHSGFNMARAKTGRLSSSEPNLQQVPGHLHSLFIAAPGRKFITKDVGAIEPAILAYYSEDPNLCKLVLEGRSFHSVNVKVIFPEIETAEKDIKTEHPDKRDAVKECGLSVIYGAKHRRVGGSFQKRGIHLTEAVCCDIVERLLEKYSGVWNFKDDIDSRMRKEKRLVNLLGRPFHIAGKDIYMLNLNRLIQGSASDLVLAWATNCWNEFKLREIDAAPVLFIHDEVVVDAPADRAEECDRIMMEQMEKISLSTVYGDIKLTLEGNIANYWSK